MHLLSRNDWLDRFGVGNLPQGSGNGNVGALPGRRRHRVCREPTGVAKSLHATGHGRRGHSREGRGAARGVAKGRKDGGASRYARNMIRSPRVERSECAPSRDVLVTACGMTEMRVPIALTVHNSRTGECTVTKVTMPAPCLPA